jgi:hypothetical protein
MITWGSSKQPNVAASTVESEYAAAATAILQAVYLRAKLSEMLQITLEELTKIMCDN